MTNGNNNDYGSSWSDSFAMGITEIDSQHKRFFDLIDETCSKLDDCSQDELNSVISRLEKYSGEHFAYEEELMKKAGFEDIEDHVDKHRFFMNKIDDLKLESSYMNPGLAGRLIGFMRKWFISHILYHDNQYRDIVLDYLKSKR